MSTIREEIYYEHFGGHHVLRFSDLPEDMLPDDQIEMTHVEGFYSENNSWDAYSELRVFHVRETTEEEKVELKAHFAKLKAESKEKRRLQFLKLQEEFKDE